SIHSSPLPCTNDVSLLIQDVYPDISTSWPHVISFSLSAPRILVCLESLLSTVFATAQYQPCLHQLRETQMVQLPIKDIVSDALRLSVREPRVFATLSWVSLFVSTAMFMSAYLAQDRTAKKVLAAIAYILQRVFDTESLYRLMGEMLVALYRL